MFEHFITTIDYKKLIEMQANNEVARFSKDGFNSKSKNQTNLNKVTTKVRKIGKR